MIVVSDTTAITILLKCGDERLLQQLFGTVIIPAGVAGELHHFHSALPAFVSVRHLIFPVQLFPGAERLGRGETEALQLALQLHADLLLTDDKQARRAAAQLHLPCAGLLGIVIDAKRKGLIRHVKPLIAKLQTEGGLYLSESVKAAALMAAGE
jgi:predicted nucleic acid-binding protein